jgi:hypothetical protein
MIILGSHFHGHGQTDTLLNLESDPDLYINNLEQTETIEGEMDLSDQMSSEWNVLQKKFNINDLSEDVALHILKMTDFQYYQLLKYIDLHGALLTIYELNGIEGFDYPDLLKWIPYLEVKPIKNGKALFKNFFSFSEQQLLIREIRTIEDQEGYSDEAQNPYPGSPDHLTFKYSFKSNDWFQLAISGEKDAGETFFKGDNKKGFNFYSYHLQIKNVRLIRKLIMGDYRVHFGQGLIIGNGINMGGNSEIQIIKSSLQGVSVMNETPLIKGISCEIGNHKIQGIVFGGYQMVSDSVVGPIFGGSVKWNTQLLRLGVHFVQVNHNNYVPVSEKWYQKGLFAGYSNQNFSLDHQVILGSTLFFGEWGFSMNGGYGFLQGIKIPIDPATKMQILFRKYSSGFQSILGNSYGKRSALNNETGILATLTTSISRKLDGSIYSDLYRSEWVQYLIDKPCDYIDMGTNLNYKISRDAQVELRYGYKSVYKNKKNLYFNEIEYIHQHKLKLHLAWQPIDKIKLKTEVIYRINISDSLQKVQKTDLRKGFLISQDLQYSIEKPDLQIHCRIALFESDTYNERIYAYENDLQYCFTVNNYYDKGVRYYLIIRYKLGVMTIQGRISRTVYQNKQTVGSGNDQINQNHKTEVKIQTIFNF